MSSTGRGAAYLPLAAYLTPQRVADGLVRLLSRELSTPQVVLEPSVGGGAFLHAVSDETKAINWRVREGYTRAGHPPAPSVEHRYMAIDVDPNATGFAVVRSLHGSVQVGDFLRTTPPLTPTLIVGNPPFSLPTKGGKPQPAAELHVKRAMAMLPPGGHLAFLLRLAMLEGVERRKTLWMHHRPKRVYVLDRRPSFTGTGSDSAAYGFFVWQKDYAGPTNLEVVDWSAS